MAIHSPAAVQSPGQGKVVTRRHETWPDPGRDVSLVPPIATRGRDKNTMAIKYQIVTISEIYSVTILRFLRTQHFMLTVTVGCCGAVVPI